MRRDFKLEKRAIIFGLTILLVADAALVVYSWNLASTPRTRHELESLSHTRDLLRADIKRAQDIREKIPAIQKDCDRFEQSMFPASTGYSSVAAELDTIASKAGLRLESKSFRQDDVKGRGLASVVIDATVIGSYSGVVHFLNGLQRSNNFYAVEALSAKTEGQNQAATRGGVRVTMHIRTYFRTA
jgi:hypothetical protein